jgi:RNA polymerase sigma-70 factor (sigma-E family)
MAQIARLVRLVDMGAAMGDEDPFGLFVRLHSERLYQTAYLLTGSVSQAEELLQDTFARLYPRWARVAASDSPVAYVRRSLANGFVSGRRRRSGRDVSLTQVIDDSDGGDVAETIANRHLLWQLLRTLPPRQRAALVLRYFHDMPDDEVAEALGCRVATVRSLVSRGVVAMRVALDPALMASPTRSPGRSGRTTR